MSASSAAPSPLPLAKKKRGGQQHAPRVKHAHAHAQWPCPCPGFRLPPLFVGGGPPGHAAMLCALTRTAAAGWQLPPAGRRAG